ncbi:hypothetical protein W97_08629 [Coniosporium apollinis CBS 100218]|uniref:Uncharacterized protein n=1 Tax=Coniosporium apollinis (strain CBS 100218) TaxID=1168221 RepID=R7Z5S4_CONA1|nr:uncharacterized protein W97_08629 [Coniosporium apollinis CBS 100218]EON69369.1 hypothetical protein W97_08629 [Coniosporium apollinis CBS 100218]
MSSQVPSRKVATLTGHNGAVHAVSYSAGAGQYILTGSTDRTIRLFNPATTRLIQSYTAHGYEVLDLAVAADNARFVSVGGDKTVFLWDVATARTLTRFSGHAGRINACAFGGTDDSVIVSGSFDATVRLWDTKSGSHKPLMVLSEAKDSISAVAVAGHEIFAGSVDGRVRVYDLRMGQCFVDVLGHPVTSVTATKSADSLLVGCLDSVVRLMDRADGKLLKAYKAPGEFVNDNYRVRSTLGLNDSVVVSGSEDGRVFVWDLLSGDVVKRLWHGEARSEDAKSGKRDVVSAVAFCQARKEWCSAGGDGNVVVWGTVE